MCDKDHGLDKNALDRYITGNYGEDQFSHKLCIRCKMYPPEEDSDYCDYCIEIQGEHDEKE